MIFHLISGYLHNFLIQERVADENDDDDFMEQPHDEEIDAPAEEDQPNAPHRFQFIHQEFRVLNVGALAGIPYHLYMSIKWSLVEATNYDPILIVWLGSGFLVNLHLISLSALFLSIDRCLIILTPFRHKRRVVKLLPIAMTACLFCWGIAVLIFYVFWQPEQQR
ncbi:hypothetical protein DdX_19560 [Ditylenchus destructor]|uniref:Uncharacterized protein n=1 Tax=Ditylenchus destructor TaxID=166010 RepID=A0AAD4MI65_9BILA|nr:hypothetical protein DdX_19560 [Ditylenchus destructor]